MRAHLSAALLLMMMTAALHAGMVHAADGRLEVISGPTTQRDPRSLAGKRGITRLRRGKQTGLSQGGRKLLGPDGASFQPYYSSVGAACPAVGYSGDFPPITSTEGLGELVYDGRICANALVGTMYGAAAQDFTTNANWETYGYAYFTAPSKPAGSDASQASVQGLQLQVLGALGRGTSGNCTLTGVSVVIMGSTAAGEPNKADIVYNQIITLPGRGDSGTPTSTWSWDSNSTAVVAFDLVDLVPGLDSSAAQIGPTNIELDFQKGYWLRVKLIVPYVGTNTARCFAYWATSPTAANPGQLGRWQEAVGGSSGYGTTCLGAAGGASITTPPSGQTLSSCFNGQAPSSASASRCLSYRMSTELPITCPAPFSDFVFALYGSQGQGGGGAGSA